MAKLTQHVCDMCGELLNGRYGKTDVAKPYISILGKVSLQNQDIPGDYNYIFLTAKEEIDYKFCNINCLGDWIEMKRTRYLNTRQSRLREEADFEARNPYRQ